jgi:hypothetical protein
LRADLSTRGSRQLHVELASGLESKRDVGPVPQVPRRLEELALAILEL